MPSAGIANPPTAIEVPLKARRYNYYALVPLGPGKPAWFLVDTGSYRSFISEKGLSRLIAAGAKPEKDGTFTLESLTLGGRPIPAVNFALEGHDEPNPMDSESDGLIGMDVWSRYRIGLDLGSSKILLWPTNVPVEDVCRTWFVSGQDKNKPLQVASASLVPDKVGTFFLPVTLNGTTVPMTPDTGAAYSSVTRSTAKALNWTKPIDEILIGSAKPVRTPIYGIEKLSVGGLAIPWMSRIGAEDYEYGVLGDNILGELKMLLDFKGRRAYFTLKTSGG